MKEIRGLGRIREIIAVDEKGHSGIHQMGFRRYAELTLECGHKRRISWWRRGDRPDGRRVSATSLPEVGGTHECDQCTHESIHGFVDHLPHGRQTQEWTSLPQLMESLGMTEGELYHAASEDANFDRALGRITGYGPIYQDHA